MPPTLAAATMIASGRLRFEPGEHIGLPRQVEARAVGGRQLAIFRGKPAQQGRADHAAMAADPDALALDRKMLAAHRRFAFGDDYFERSLGRED